MNDQFFWLDLQTDQESSWLDVVEFFIDDHGVCVITNVDGSVQHLNVADIRFLRIVPAPLANNKSDFSPHHGR